MNLRNASPRQHACNAAHDATHGERSFVIRQKDLADAMATIVPAPQQAQDAPWFRLRAAFFSSGNESRTCCTRDSMDCDFACSTAWMQKRHRTEDRSALDAKENDRIGQMARLDHQAPTDGRGGEQFRGVDFEPTSISRAEHESRRLLRRPDWPTPHRVATIIHGPGIRLPESK